MLNQTANQLSVFLQCVLLGGGFAVFTSIIRLFSEKIIKDKLYKIIEYVVFAILAAATLLFYYLNLTFVDYRLYIPIGFLVGALLAKIPINEIIAYFQKMLYNKKKKAGK